MQTDKLQVKYTWEEAIEILRNDPAHQDLIYYSYLTRDLVSNCERFAASDEFAEVLRLLGRYAPEARRALDMPGGNGIATYALARAGFDVTCVEPDPSATLGRGAIEHVLRTVGSRAHVVGAFGEQLPFADGEFDFVFVRQGLHHARDLQRMVSELARVLRHSGALIACREHVVDDYGRSLQAFFDSQVDHQLYGGENAFTLVDYRAALKRSGLKIEVELGPYDSVINSYPNTPEVLRKKILESRPGRLLAKILPTESVVSVGKYLVKRRKPPGRLYSFLALKI